MIPEKIKAKINLYGEIYIQCYALALKVNQPNARYIANEMFREVSKDTRTELISRLQNGLQDGYMGVNEDKAIAAPFTDPKQGNGKLATDKQKHALRKFGIERIPENLGIKEAGEILEILVCHSREGDHEAVTGLVGKFNKEWAGTQATAP